MADIFAFILLILKFFLRKYIKNHNAHLRFENFS